MNDSDTQPIDSLNDGANKRSRKPFLWILAAFLGPLLLAILLYSQLEMWKPASRGNHGELLLPTQALEFLDLKTADGKPLTLDTIKGRWSMIYVSSGGCNTACEASLFKARQVRSMMGRDIDRLQYLFVALDQTSMDAAIALLKNHPKMMAGQNTGLQSGQQEKAFGDDSPGYIYLLDPYGNIVLRYGDEATTRGIHKDLRKLFKLSRIG